MYSMSNACNENNVDYSNFESVNVIDMLYPSNNFKQDVSHDKDYNECSNQEWNTSLKAINCLRADCLQSKENNQISLFKDEIKQIIMEHNLDDANTSRMD